MDITDSGGRNISVPFAARGAQVTCSATLTTGTVTTLLAGDTDYLLDLLEVTFSNQSTSAVIVTLKDDGTNVRTLNIPASSFYELTPQIPIIQGKKGGSWQVQMADVTGTTINIDGTYIKNT